MRRLASKTVFGDAISPIIGGIGRYKPSNYPRLAREASCAAEAFAARQAAQRGTPGYSAAAEAWDDRQIHALMTQAAQALAQTDIRIANNTPQHWCQTLGVTKN